MNLSLVIINHKYIKNQRFGVKEINKNAKKRKISIAIHIFTLNNFFNYNKHNEHNYRRPKDALPLSSPSDSLVKKALIN